MTKPVGMVEVHVEYRWLHNHVDSPATRARIPMSKNDLDWIKFKVAEGCDWHSIRSSLRLTNEALLAVGEFMLEHQVTLESVPPSLSMLYDGVRAAVYRQKKQESRKSAHPVLSVKLWIEQIESQGGKGISMDSVAGDSTKFMCAWSTKFQLMVEDSNKMRYPMNAIRKADSDDSRREAMHNFRAQFLPNAETLINYLDKWMQPHKLAKWAIYMREGHQQINTNNLVESWHKTLKEQHLRKERNLRPDDLIYLLQGVVDVDFRTTYLRIVNDMQDVKLLEHDHKRKSKAMVISFNDAQNMVTAMIEDQKFLIKSFTTDSKYSVSSDKTFTHLVSCSCEDFVKEMVPCKHMYLAQRVYPGLKVSYGGDITFKEEVENPTDNSEPEPGLPHASLESTLPLHIRLMLQRQRAEKAQAVRIAKQRENDQAFMDCEATMEASLKAIEVALSARRKRRCTLQYMQSTAAALRNMELEVQGLNTSHAGQRCQR
ncbi:hypothetical protein BGX26_004058 [Mortierella sp. AD094]|nr:hypothetical protein BGX26_004058 [Mortierella sp. AD094]